MDLRDGVVQILIILADGLKLGKQHQSLRADFDARAVAGEQLDAPGILQIGDHAADGGLGVAQLGSGVSDAPRFDGFQIGNVLSNAHVHGAPYVSLFGITLFQFGMSSRKNNFLYILPSNYIILNRKIQQNQY